jgi:hypothetical protein
VDNVSNCWIFLEILLLIDFQDMFLSVTAKNVPKQEIAEDSGSP